MSRVRGFEAVSKYSDVKLPESATKDSAGYDFFALEDVIIPSLVRGYLGQELNGVNIESVEDILPNLEYVKPTLVPTGVKAYMQEGEVLKLYNRSSAPIKKQLILPNSVGIIDGDYYNNEGNEGHIFFQFINIGPNDVIIKAGEAIGQGIFIPYLVADSGNGDDVRVGGFGSTSE